MQHRRLQVLLHTLAYEKGFTNSFFNILLIPAVRIEEVVEARYLAPILQIQCHSVPNTVCWLSSSS